MKKQNVGQPIFKQPIDFIPKNKLDILARERSTNRYYKSVPVWTQLVMLRFGVFSRRDSLREICDGIAAMQGTLNQ